MRKRSIIYKTPVYFLRVRLAVKFLVLTYRIAKSARAVWHENEQRKRRETKAGRKFIEAQ